MPRYTDPSTGRSIRSDSPLSDADLEEAFGGGDAGAAPPPAPTSATTTTPESTTPLERAGGYLYDKANQWVGSLQGLQADITGAVTGKDLVPGDRGWLERLGDVATVSAPLVAPWQTAAGIAAGAATRAAGGGQAVAELADIGANLATGGVQAAVGAGKAVRGANLTKVETKLAGGATEETAGEVLQSTVPSAAKQVREEVQAATYTPAAQIAQQRGLGLMSNSPEASQLGDTLLDIEGKWSSLWGPAERRAFNGLMERITSPKPTLISYADLDATKLALTKVKGASSIRGVIDDTLNTLVKGTPAEELRAAGGAQWASRVDPARKIAKLVQTADTPTTAFSRTIGRMTDARRATRVRDMVGADSTEWQHLTEGFYAKFLRGADNPAILAKKWAKMPEEVRTLFDPTGKATKMIEGLQGPGGVARGVARVTTGAAAVGAGASGVWDIAHGRWQSGFTKMLTAAALASGQSRPGTLAAAGALPPLARTAVGVSGPVIGMREELLGPKPAEPPQVSTESPPSVPVESPPPAQPAAEPPGPRTASPSPAFLESPEESVPREPPSRSAAPQGRSGALPVYPNAKGFVFHHSGGDTLEELRTTLRQRGLGSQYLMDRDGTIYSFAGPGSSHMEPNDRWGGKAPGLSNRNAIGMEIVARDNNDLTPAQIASARRFIAQNYPKIPVYGHGEVNPGHKQSDEGMAVVNNIRRYRQGGGLGDREWDTVTGIIGVPAKLMRSVMQRESSGDPTAVSKSGARGLFQIMPHTFELFRPEIEKLTGRPADIDDPLDNFIAGTLHMRDDLKATNGNVELAARRYNAGPDPEKQNNPTTFEYARDVARGFGQDRV